MRNFFDQAATSAISGGMTMMVRKGPRVRGAKLVSKPSSRAKLASSLEKKKGAKTHGGGTGAVKKKTVRSAAPVILPAAKGPRTLTHRQIKRAVEQVFRERYGTDA